MRLSVGAALQGKRSVRGPHRVANASSVVIATALIATAALKLPPTELKYGAAALAEAVLGIAILAPRTRRPALAAVAAAGITLGTWTAWHLVERGAASPCGCLGGTFDATVGMSLALQGLGATMATACLVAGAGHRA